MNASSSSNHFSTFELDVYFASPTHERETSSSEIDAHITSCSRCRAYLDDLDASSPPPWLSDTETETAPVRAPAPQPQTSSTRTALHEEASPRSEKTRRIFSGSTRGRIASAASVLALAACAILYLKSRAAQKIDDDAGYVGEKGLPAAQILVRRDGQVRVWDGASPVRAGDAIAVDVACEQFTHVTVAAEEEGNNSGSATLITRAWEGVCPTRTATTTTSTLPFTLVVDDQPGREHFSVVLSREPLTDDRLRAALHRSGALSAPRNGGIDTWTIDFAFAKEER